MHAKVISGLALTVALALSAEAEELRFSSFEPPVAFLTGEVFPAWGSRVEEATGGEVTIKMFPGGTLGRSPAQQLKLVEDGVADVAFVVPGYTPGVFPGLSVAELPYTVTTSADGSVALWEMLESGLLKGDFDKYKIIGLFVTSPQNVASTDQILMPEDMKGRSFRAASPSLLAAIEEMDAVAVGGITGPTIAESISRGVIEGSFNEWNALKTFRVMDTVDHVLEVPMGTTPLMIVMNKQKYESLSDEAKAGLDKVSGAPFAAVLGAAFHDNNEAARAAAVEEGRIKITEPDQATLEAWRDATLPAVENWLAEDPDNAALLDAFRAAMSN